MPSSGERSAAWKDMRMEERRVGRMSDRCLIFIRFPCGKVRFIGEDFNGYSTVVWALFLCWYYAFVNFFAL